MGGWARCPEAVPALRFGAALTFFPSPFLGVLSIETLSDHSGRQGVIPLTWSWQLTPGAPSFPERCYGSEDIWAVFMEVEARGSLWWASERGWPVNTAAGGPWRPHSIGRSLRGGACPLGSDPNAVVSPRLLWGVPLDPCLDAHDCFLTGCSNVVNRY